MAKQIITVLTDDLVGGAADTTVEFGLDGATYTIDLSDKNATTLRSILEPYRNAATRTGRRTGGKLPAQGAAVSPKANRDQNQVIRE
jgi:hypothetical protein